MKARMGIPVISENLSRISRSRGTPRMLAMSPPILTSTVRVAGMAATARAMLFAA